MNRFALGENHERLTMNVQGTRLPSDYLITRYAETVVFGLPAHQESLVDLPDHTRWQRTCRGARLGANFGAYHGAWYGFKLPERASLVHAFVPQSRASFGTVYISAIGLQAPTLFALFGASFLVGSGKMSDSIDLREDYPASTVLTQYGLVGLPEFGLACASAALESRGQHLGAGACRVGSALLALALEAPRLVAHISRVALSLALAFAGATIGLVVGGALGSLTEKASSGDFCGDRGPPPGACETRAGPTPPEERMCSA